MAVFKAKYCLSKWPILVVFAKNKFIITKFPPKKLYNIDPSWAVPNPLSHKLTFIVQYSLGHFRFGGLLIQNETTECEHFWPFGGQSYKCSIYICK